MIKEHPAWRIGRSLIKASQFLVVLIGVIVGTAIIFFGIEITENMKRWMIGLVCIWLPMAIYEVEEIHTLLVKQSRHEREQKPD